MRITIIAVGRLRAGPEKSLSDHFRGRLNAWNATLREVEEKRRLDGDALKRAEGELILAAIPDGAVLVALDERGKSPTSRQFARQISDWQDDGVSDIAFAIGGADGLSDAVCKHARLVLCFGAMTWPHFVVRGLLFEQLYRAQQIIAGHPYHRD
ncbi:MAG: 23S rRNA (pseudouridine1915-N3)-methyltransferase [Alphaproteobacteria bacterium]|jgi:23S rRNA (pseudouridine1915-N3)-methyltransferase